MGDTMRHGCKRPDAPARCKQRYAHRGLCHECFINHILPNTPHHYLAFSNDDNNTPPTPMVRCIHCCSLQSLPTHTCLLRDQRQQQQRQRQQKPSSSSKRRTLPSSSSRKKTAPTNDNDEYDDNPLRKKQRRIVPKEKQDDDDKKDDDDESNTTRSDVDSTQPTHYDRNEVMMGCIDDVARVDIQALMAELVSTMPPDDDNDDDDDKIEATSDAIMCTMRNPNVVPIECTRLLARMLDLTRRHFVRTIVP